jgi:DNA-binding CsgD family transcriptional regulator
VPEGNIDTSSLFERGRVLARLRASLEAAASSNGRVLLVPGPPGIGKTRVALAARAAARSHGFAVQSARGAELETSFPFGVVRQLLEPMLRGCSDEERAQLLTGAAALAGPVLLDELPDNPQAADSTFAALHGLYWLCANRAEHGPLALIVDDAHWADQPSLRFLAFLAHRVDELPILLMVLHRPDADAHIEGIAREPHSESLELAPLSLVAVAELLGPHASAEVDREFARACHRATGGNPFYLQELIRALREQAVPFTAKSAKRVETLGPKGVASALERRLAALPSEAGRLVRALAILGDDSSLELAATLAGLTQDAAEAAATLLSTAAVIEDARPLRFRHPIIRQSIEQHLPAGERIAQHARAAELKRDRGRGPDQIALHLLHTEPGREEWVIDTLESAADTAAARGAPDTAVALLKRALAELPPAPRRTETLLKLARQELTIAAIADAEEHILEAHRVAPDARMRAQALAALDWGGSGGTGNVRDRAERLMPMIDETLAALDDGDRELRLTLEGAWLQLSLVAPEAWAARSARCAQFAELRGDTPAECALLVKVANVRLESGAPAAEVVELLERALSDDVLLSRGDIFSIGVACYALNYADRFDEAERLLIRMRADAQSQGSKFGFVGAGGPLALVARLRGDIRRAEAEARGVLEAEPDPWMVIYVTAELVEALVEQRRLDEAQELLASHGLDGEVPLTHATIWLTRSRAGLHAARGELSDALADLATCQAQVEAAGRRTPETIAGLIRGALVRHLMGEGELARRDAERALAEAQNWNTPGAVGAAMRALGVITGGARGIELLELAVSTLASSPQKLEHAKALLELGAALRRSGHRRDCRPPLLESYELASAGGAKAVADRAREELAASGLRLRRQVATGVDTLTPSERRIAERAAAGASNPMIAQSLFLTVKTVEMHLSNTYRKLGISTRQELPRVLDQAA